MDAYYYAAVVLALIALVRGLLLRDDWAVFTLLVVAYWTLVHVVFYGEPRLHVPLHPMIAMAAGVALVDVWTSVRGNKRVVESGFPSA